MWGRFKGKEGLKNMAFEAIDMTDASPPRG